jgi:hypothetical protein
MSADRCSRQWQVEAVRDGRIQKSERERVLRHIEQCVQCSREARKLEALGGALHSLPAVPVDALAAHRLRQRLLSDLNSSLLDARPARAKLDILLALAASGLAAAAFWAVQTGRAQRWIMPQPKPESQLLEVTAEPGARWRELRTGKLTRVELTEGEAAFKIHRTSPAESVTVVLPDGEIEDLGTVFSVSVYGQKTTRISVSQGRILVRLRARPELLLKAGDSWVSQPDAATSDQRGTRPVPSSSAEPAAALGASAETVKRHPAPVPAEKPPALASTGRSEPRSLARSLDAGVAPGGSRDEDDAYLEIVSLVRRGRSDAAREAANSYLRRFPDGFRREEVLNVATRGR